MKVPNAGTNVYLHMIGVVHPTRIRGWFKLRLDDMLSIAWFYGVGGRWRIFLVPRHLEACR